MYTSFYQLDNKPFELSPDPSFLWSGEKYKEALSTLRYGIFENKGFLLLTGAAGSGKTTLINSLTHNLGGDVEWAVIDDPRLERIDFYNTIARGFGIDKPFSSKVQFLIQFSHFLHKSDDEHKRALLLVDDCHLLSQEMLEELRLLSNIEKADTKLINIFFVGQSDFNELLHQPKNRAVSQRLSLTADLPPLTVNETEDYILHRLSIAGTEERLFAARAVQAVHRFSRGIPRQINIICDQALAVGASQGLRTIDNKVVEAVVQGMDHQESPFQGDYEPLSPEQNDLINLSGKFVPKPTEVVPPLSGFNLEREYKRGWLKYLIGLLMFCTAGSYFWYSTSNSLESGGQLPVESVTAPVGKSIAKVSSSPAVTMLEENKSDINEKKAAELKTAILAKAYGEKVDILQTEKAADDTGTGRSETTEAAIAPPIDAVDAAILRSAVQDKVTEQVKDSRQVTVQENSAAAEKSTPGQRVVLHNDLPKKILEIALAEPEQAGKGGVETVVLPPLEPKKVVLGLRPNSSKLTRDGQRKLNSFVDKLKLYPGATVFVKGYVSAKTNSPENIKLSKERAQRVQKLMLAKGIDAEQIEVVGMGNQDPIASNDTRTGRRKNRRVEIHVISDGMQ